MSSKARELQGSRLPHFNCPYARPLLPHPTAVGTTPILTPSLGHNLIPLSNNIIVHWPTTLHNCLHHYKASRLILLLTSRFRRTIPRPLTTTPQTLLSSTCRASSLLVLTHLQAFLAACPGEKLKGWGVKSGAHSCCLYSLHLNMSQTVLYSLILKGFSKPNQSYLITSWHPGGRSVYDA